MDADQIRKKFREPVEAAARRLFRTKDGEIVMKALVDVYGSGIMAKSLDGSTDASGTLINVGSYNVVEYLRRLAADKEE